MYHGATAREGKLYRVAQVGGCVVIGHEGGDAGMLMRAHSVIEVTFPAETCSFNVTAPGGRRAHVCEVGTVITNLAPQLRPWIPPLSSPCLSHSQVIGREAEGAMGGSWGAGGGDSIEGWTVSARI